MSGFAPPPNEGTIVRLVTGAELIERERKRQTRDEGWTPEHDAGHDHDELVLAAVQYALPENRRSFPFADRGDGWMSGYGSVPTNWPWEDAAWKPTPDDRVKELVKAGALIAAEIDRLLR